MPRAVAVSATSPNWEALYPSQGNVWNRSCPRHCSRKNQPITVKAAQSGTWVRPIIRSIHCSERSGDFGMRPSARAVRSEVSKITQKRTAGPRRGPEAHSTQRSSPTPSELWMLALSTGKRTAPLLALKPSGRFSFQPTESSCSPGRSGITNLEPSRRTGISRPKWVSRVISASAGSSMRKSSPRLQRMDRWRVERRWRCPTVTSWIARFRVTVAPAMPSGRWTFRFTVSPGHGCQTGSSWVLPDSKTGAKPDSDTFHTGEATRCQRSIQVSVGRVVKVSVSTGARLLSHENAVSCAPRRTSMPPSCTTRPCDKTFSPGNRGMRIDTALPTGERRWITVWSCHCKPSSRRRCTATIGWRSWRSYVAAAAATFCFGEKKTCCSGTPSARTPTTVQSGASMDT